MRIAVLNNLRAGRSATQVSRLLGYLRTRPDVLHVETDSARAVPEALADLARQGVDVLAVNGGDGTLQQVLTELLAERAFDDRIPYIAPLRGGRTNMSALDLGVQRDPVKALDAIVRAAREDRLGDLQVTRDVLRVEHGDRPGREVVCGMFFGVGLIHRGIELSHRLLPRGRSQGVAGSTLITAGLMAKFVLQGGDGILAPDKLQVLVDGRPLPDGEFTLWIASSLDRMFARMRPFLGDEPAPVRFTAIASGAHRLTRALPGLLRGRARSWVTPENGYHSANAHRVILRMDCGFTVDGELWDPQPDRVVSLGAHERVRFLRG